MTRIGIRDELLSAQTLRAMGSAPYGGADIGECLAAARRAGGADPARWHDAWTAAARAASPSVPGAGPGHARPGAAIAAAARAQRSRRSSSSWWIRSRHTAMAIISTSSWPGATSTP